MPGVEAEPQHPEQQDETVDEGPAVWQELNKLVSASSKEFSAFSHWLSLLLQCDSSFQRSHEEIVGRALADCMNFLHSLSQQQQQQPQHAGECFILLVKSDRHAAIVDAAVKLLSEEGRSDTLSWIHGFLTSRGRRRLLCFSVRLSTGCVFEHTFDAAQGHQYKLEYKHDGVVATAVCVEAGLTTRKMELEEVQCEILLLRWQHVEERNCTAYWSDRFPFYGEVWDNAHSVAAVFVEELFRTFEGTTIVLPATEATARGRIKATVMLNFAPKTHDALLSNGTLHREAGAGGIGQPCTRLLFQIVGRKASRLWQVYDDNNTVQVDDDWMSTLTLFLDRMPVLFPSNWFHNGTCGVVQ